MSDLTYARTLERARNLCARREMCSREMRDKLTAWGVEGEDVQKILQKLTEQKFIDDRRYANAYARQQHLLRKWGKIKIRMMLQRKEIPEPFIEEALDGLDEEVYRQTLREELRKKRRTIKAKNRYDLLARLQQFAYGRGYEPDLARRLAEEIAGNTP